MRAGWRRPARLDGRRRAAFAGLALVALPALIADAQEAPSGPATVLPSITMEGQAETSSTATIGEPPPTFAGGPVARDGRLGALGNRDCMDTPFSTQSFTRALIEDRQPDGVTDVIKLDPAVSRTRGGDFTSIGYFRIRGFADYTSLNAAASLDGLVGILGADPPAEFLERVDLIKGPNAFLNGAFARIGGSSSFILKRAPGLPVHEAAGTYASDSVVGGRLWLEAAHLRDNRRSYGHRYSLKVADGVGLPAAPNNDVFTQPPWVSYESSQGVALDRAECDLAERWTVAASARRSEFRSFYNSYCAVAVLDADGASQCDAGFGVTRYEALTGDMSLRGDVATRPLRHQLLFGANGFDTEQGPKPYLSTGTFLYEPCDSSYPYRDRQLRAGDRWSDRILRREQADGVRPPLRSTQHQAGVKLELDGVGATRVAFRIKKVNQLLDGIRLLAGIGYIDAELGEHRRQRVRRQCHPGSAATGRPAHRRAGLL